MSKRENIEAERLHQALQSRSGAKGSFTRTVNKINDLMKDEANVNAVKTELQNLQRNFERFREYHDRYHSLLKNVEHIAQSNKYYDLTLATFRELDNRTQDWLLEYENIEDNENDAEVDKNPDQEDDDINPDQDDDGVHPDQEDDINPEQEDDINLEQEDVDVNPDQEDDDINPDDSASNVKTTMSSVSSARAKAAAKKASLLIRAKALQRLQEIEMEKIRIQQQREQIEIDTEIAVAEAEEQVYADAEDARSSRSGSSKRSKRIDKREKPRQPAEIRQQCVNDSQSKSASPSCRADPNALKKQMNQSPLDINEPCQFEPKRDILGEILLKSQEQQSTLIDLMQLPKAELCKFDGDPLQYWRFIRAFDNTVGSASTDSNAKLTRLMQYCTGKALKVISCCAVMEPNEGYIKARELLQTRFGNDYSITEAWIGKMTQGGYIKPNDPKALQEFADDLRCCKETLGAMNKLDEIDTQRSIVKIVEKLPLYLQNRWKKEAIDTKRRSGKYPGIDYLVIFVEHSAEEANDPVFGNISSNASYVNKKGGKAFDSKRRGYGISAMVTSQTQEQRSKDKGCLMCGGSHSLFGCDTFKRSKPEDRFKFVRSKRLCDNCLNYGHFANRCNKPSTCSVPGCGKKHTKFIHVPIKPPAQDNNEVSSGPDETHAGASASSNYLSGAGRNIALPIVPVRVRGSQSSSYVITYALLDTGSTNSFCCEQLLRQLHLTGRATELTLSTLEKDKSVHESKMVSLEISDIDGVDYIKVPHVYSRSRLPISLDSVPNQDDIREWDHLRDIQLPSINATGVSLLIGQDVPEALIPMDIIKGNRGEPYATKTVFGWTLNGPLRMSSHHHAVSNFISADVRLDKQVEKMWKLDFNEYADDDITQMSIQDKRVISLWNKSIVLNNNHYEMPIPFKCDPPILSDNRCVAEHRLQLLSKKLNKDPDMYSKYDAGIQELIDKEYAEEVPEDQISMSDRPVWYLPHHLVLNPNKPGKLRMVFDCAAKYHGTSLNDQVLQGPDLMNKLIGVLMRFREESVAIMGDVEAMYHQVRVTPRDRDVLRFLWWTDKSQTQVKIYRMAVHLFGGIWSPSCANYALKRTADDNHKDFDIEAVTTVKQNFYVDDCLKSVISEDAAIKLVDQLSQLLLKGGFRLTKWVSNSREVLKSIPDSEKVSDVKDLDLDRQSLPIERALGVRWNVEKDTLELKASIQEKPLTKRGIISMISSVYDPLGMASPFLLPAKLIFQELCRKKVAWDDPLPEKEANLWFQWINDLPKLDMFQIPRCIKPSSFGQIVSCQLHHFSDASQKGYGAVSYLRLANSSGNISCAFVIAKARLAPLKTMTIPRLELSAATLSIKLDQQIRREICVPVNQSVFWTDSMLVLQYVKNETKRFHTFVANRITAIHNGSSPDQWRHVGTKCNPADDVSRGLTAEELIMRKSWVHGPEFLWHEEDMWPVTPVSGDVPDGDPEVKTHVNIFQAIVNEHNAVDKLLKSYSSWFCLKKAVAWFLRIKQFLHRKIAKKEKSMNCNSDITVRELNDAAIAIT